MIATGMCSCVIAVQLCPCGLCVALCLLPLGSWWAHEVTMVTPFICILPTLTCSLPALLSVGTHPPFECCLLTSYFKRMPCLTILPTKEVCYQCPCFGGIFLPLSGCCHTHENGHKLWIFLFLKTEKFKHTHGPSAKLFK